MWLVSPRVDIPSLPATAMSYVNDHDDDYGEEETTEEGFVGGSGAMRRGGKVKIQGLPAKTGKGGKGGKGGKKHHRGHSAESRHSRGQSVDSTRSKGRRGKGKQQQQQHRHNHVEQMLQCICNQILTMPEAKESGEFRVPMTSKGFPSARRMAGDLKKGLTFQDNKAHYDESYENTPDDAMLHFHSPTVDATKNLTRKITINVHMGEGIERPAPRVKKEGEQTWVLKGGPRVVGKRHTVVFHIKVGNVEHTERKADAEIPDGVAARAPTTATGSIINLI